jgi:DNA polymerase-1
MQRSFGERVARNSPIQGTAADIIKIAMVKVHDRLIQNGLESRLVLQVHDELLIEAKNEELDTVKKLLVEEMENAVKLNVPLIADLQTGDNWYETH